MYINLCKTCLFIFLFKYQHLMNKLYCHFFFKFDKLVQIWTDYVEICFRDIFFSENFPFLTKYSLLLRCWHYITGLPHIYNKIKVLNINHVLPQFIYYIIEKQKWLNIESFLYYLPLYAYCNYYFVIFFLIILDSFSFKYWKIVETYSTSGLTCVMRIKSQFLR